MMGSQLSATAAKSQTSARVASHPAPCEASVSSSFCCLANCLVEKRLSRHRNRHAAHDLRRSAVNTHLIHADLWAPRWRLPALYFNHYDWFLLHGLAHLKCNNYISDTVCGPFIYYSHLSREIIYNLSSCPERNNLFVQYPSCSQ